MIENIETQLIVEYFWPPGPTKIRFRVYPEDYDLGDIVAHGATIKEALEEYLEFYEMRHDEELLNYKWK